MQMKDKMQNVIQDADVGQDAECDEHFPSCYRQICWFKRGQPNYPSTPLLCMLL
jgi:hypothetical protein